MSGNGQTARRFAPYCAPWTCLRTTSASAPSRRATRVSTDGFSSASPPRESIAAQSVRRARPSARTSPSGRAPPPRRPPVSGPACAAGREISPDAAAWRGTSNTVSRALSLIAEGVLDDSDIAGLCDRLGRSASGSCVACSTSIWARRRSRWRRPAHPVRQAAHPGYRAADDSGCECRWLRQRAPLQRHVPQALSPPAAFAAPQARIRALGGHAEARLSRAI